MARKGGFPVEEEDVLETVIRMLRTAGEVEAVSGYVPPPSKRD